MFGFADQKAMQKFKETKNKDYRNSLSRLVIIKNKKEKTTNSYIMTIIGEPSYLEKHNFELWSNTYFEKDKDFAGTVLFHNVDGDFVNGWKLRDGKVYGKITVKDLNIVTKKSCSSYTTTTVTYEECTDYYNYTYTVGEPDSGYLNDEIAYTTCETWTEDTISYNYCPTTPVDPGVNNNGGYNPGNDEGDYNIDDADLKNKEKCLHNHLDKNGDSYVKEIMKNFKGDSEFDIKIESKDKVFTDGEEDNGRTFGPVNGLINIEISTSQAVKNSALEVARTILHEYIHADMFRKLNTKHNYPSSEDLNFKITYEAFKNGNFEASPQHETMAKLYVNSMRDALKDFHKNVLVGDYNYNTNNGSDPFPDNFYEALAWRGLKEHGVQAYKDLSITKKQELENALTDNFHSITKSCPN